MHSERGTKIRDNDEVSAGEDDDHDELGDKRKNFATDKVAFTGGDTQRSRPAYLRL